MLRHTPIITLTTDFGYRDYYVSAMKAVILTKCPRVRLVDVSHDIPPQDIMAAAWILKNSAFLYPQGTIHIAVVDPGVGTKRKPIAVEMNGHFFIGPDNGIFSLLGSDSDLNAFHILHQDIINDTVSATFHGRDIFAPAAALLANGLQIYELGEPIEHINSYKWAYPISDDEGIQGWVVHIDTYGNLITNIPEDFLQKCNEQPFKIYVGTTIINNLVTTFSDVSDGETAALIGSAGTLEICVNKGSASEMLSVYKGAPVSVVFQKA
jgi:S-adenosylmethionine hydrolase